MNSILRRVAHILFCIVPIIANADDSMLRVKCSGDDIGGAVSINGKFKGECPVDIPLQPGMYKLRVEKNDAIYDRSFEQDIRMGEGTVKKVEVELSKQLTAAGQKAQEARVLQEAAVEKIRAMAALDAKINSIEMIRIPEKNYEMGKYEVTQSEWRTVMGSNPSKFTSCGDNCPVEQVSWDNVQVFLKRINAFTGKQFRLPTEEEWQYSCKAGERGRYCGGSNIEDLAWYGSAYDEKKGGNSGSTTHPVGQKQANAFGLYDMSGNVWELTNDCWKDDCSKHLLLGGGWDSFIWEIKFFGGYIGGLENNRMSSAIGFRLARTLPSQIAAKTSENGNTTSNQSMNTPGRIGVRMLNATDDLAKVVGYSSGTGALILAVEKGGAADNAGILLLDVILTFDDKNVTTIADLQGFVTATHPGSKVKVTLWRKGEIKEISLIVGGMP